MHCVDRKPCRANISISNRTLWQRWWPNPIYCTIPEIAASTLLEWLYLCLSYVHWSLGGRPSRSSADDDTWDLHAKVLLARYCEKVLDEIKCFQNKRGRQLAEPFVQLPLPSRLPSYYKVDLVIIFKTLKCSGDQTSDGFVSYSAEDNWRRICFKIAIQKRSGLGLGQCNEVQPVTYARRKIFIVESCC